MFQCGTLQFGALCADKVESSRVLDYVALCLPSIVVYELLVLNSRVGCVMCITVARFVLQYTRTS